MVIFQRTLNIHETKYSTFDRELLAIFGAIKHFEHILDSADLIVETDHKPLTLCFSMKKPSPRQFRQLTYISLFTKTINYICGRENVVADTLSRPCVATIDNPLDLSNIIQLQHNDDELQNLDNTNLSLTIKIRHSL